MGVPTASPHDWALRMILLNVVGMTGFKEFYYQHDHDDLIGNYSRYRLLAGIPTQ